MMSLNILASSSKHKCGELFNFVKDIFSLICDACGFVCYTLEAFGAHILHDHRRPPPITTCIKQEDCRSIEIITEATAERTGLEQQPQYLTVNQTKCGEILQFFEDDFTLRCDKCADDYKTLETFGVHLLHDHHHHHHPNHRTHAASSIDVDAKNIRATSSTEYVRIEQELIEPEFVCINLKEEHYVHDVSISNVPEPKESRNRQEVIRKHSRKSCSFCDKDFSNNRDRADHENTHLGRRPYECYVCHKAFTALYSVRSHLKLHTTELPYKCSVCERGFLRRGALEIHFREKHLPTTDPRRFFPCKGCEKVFRTYSNMCHHAMQHKPAKMGIFICDHCSKTFPTRKKIVRHMIHHFVREKKECRFCHKQFADKYYHKMHEQGHQPQEAAERPQCRLCLKTFKFNRGLLRHLKNIHSTARKPTKRRPTQKTKRPHQCKMCKKNLASAAGLKKHIEMHMNVRHQCTVCPASFAAIRSLTEHTRRTHLAENQTSRGCFSCERCDVQFSNHSNLLRHIFNAHENVSGCFQCDYCQKKYLIRRYFVQHMQAHFPKTNFQKYEKIHRNRRTNVQCSLCPNAYTYRSSLARHIRLRHRN